MHHVSKIAEQQTAVGTVEEQTVYWTSGEMYCEYFDKKCYQLSKPAHTEKEYHNKI